METINIKIGLSIITHDAVSEHPFVNISINGHPQFGQICSSDTIVDLDVEIEDDTENFLTIEYQNKNANKDVILGEDNIPVQDKRIEINSISFDDIEIDFFQLNDENKFVYEPTDPEGWKTTGFDATKLSWNGRTTLRFTTPVYIWLLENL